MKVPHKGFKSRLNGSLYNVSRDRSNLEAQRFQKIVLYLDIRFHQTFYVLQYYFW